MFIQVTFSENSRAYTYMAPRSMKLEIGDIVRVPVRYNNFLKARVVAVSENPFRGVDLEEMKDVKEVVKRINEDTMPKAEVRVSIKCTDAKPREEFAKAAAVLLATMDGYITDEDKLAILRQKALVNEEVRTLLAAYDILMKG